MRATMMRTPRAMPRIKRRKPGSQEKDGRALVKCMAVNKWKTSIVQIEIDHWPMVNVMLLNLFSIIHLTLDNASAWEGILRWFQKKDFPVLHHLVFCFICSIRASLIRLSDFVSEIWTLYHIWRVAEGSHVLLLKMISGQSDGTLYGG